MYPELRKIAIFEDFRQEDAGCLGKVEVVRAPAGSPLFLDGEVIEGFWGLLEGELRAVKLEDDGTKGFMFHVMAGDSFGEVPLLTGKKAAVTDCEVISDSTLVCFAEEAFWRLLAACPMVRQAITANTQRRLQNYQAFAVHRLKLMSLGTLAAGLMHELNNPGTAARRAAAQLRENLVQLQQISLRYCESPLVDDQIQCLKELQERALTGEKPGATSSIDQSDAEECLAEWLTATGVENSWKIAPTLAAIGLTERELECTHAAFEGTAFSDALNWLVSLVSSVQLVETIEESITRVSELVVAVKKYAYNDTSGQCHVIDIHDGLRSTLTILGHKFRLKNLKIDKQFSALPVIESRAAGLVQVWTNLLDNAIDASPDGGTIHIRTWVEGNSVCVGIADEGNGIPEEHRGRIFEPFFTTKPVGVGTGLGLDIAHRIVAESFQGELGFETRPGRTEFIVRIPITT